MNKAIISILAVIVLAVGGYFVFHKSSSNTNSSTSSTATPTTTSPISSDANQNAVATITYGDNGFIPNSLTAKAGDKVAITNSSSSDIQMNSDRHPVHTDDPDLNVGSVSAGQTVTFSVTQKGSFGYHNHLNPSDRGNITVQ